MSRERGEATILESAPLATRGETTSRATTTSTTDTRGSTGMKDRPRPTTRKGSTGTRDITRKDITRTGIGTTRNTESTGTTTGRSITNEIGTSPGTTTSTRRVPRGITATAPGGAPVLATSRPGPGITRSRRRGLRT